MKLLIASDLHGSAKYCRALLESFRREGAERMLLLGDLLYHGPRNDFPEEYDTRAVTAMLNSAADKILCVRGNCDAEVDQMVLNFPIMADYCYLPSDGQTLFATHGHLLGPDNPPPLRQGEILLCGHTHLAVHQDRGAFTYLNPGSLGLPKENLPHSYLLMDGGVFSWHDVTTGEAFSPLS